MKRSNLNRASALSRLLNEHGYKPMPSGSAREGRLTISADPLDRVGVTVDLTTRRTTAEAMTGEIRDLLASHGYRLTETETTEDTLSNGAPVAFAIFYADRPEWTPKDHTSPEGRKRLALELRSHKPTAAPVQLLGHSDAHTIAELLNTLTALIPGEDLGKLAAKYATHLRRPADD